MRRRADTVRRRIVLSGCSVAMGFPPGAAWAGRLATPPQAQGPFYPLALPLDRDNDLVTVSGMPGRARGVVTDVAGRITDPDGRPVRDVRVEIWQVNAFGRYHHPHDDQDRPVDPHFQGYGSTVTDAAGSYRFRTIRPVAYPGRAPHIHFAVTGPGWGPFYTQIYVAGAPENAADFLLNSVRDRSARESLIVTLGPSPNSGSTLAGVFDIVLGSALLSTRP